MGKFIIKMEKEGDERYMEWSTIVDAPVTYGLRYDEFLAYYREEHGRRDMDDLLSEFGRMARVQKNGTSEHGVESVHDTISNNRAGDKESHLTYDEIWQKYVVEREDDEKRDEQEDPVGDFDRLRAMLARAGVEFHDVLRSGQRIVDVPVGSITVRFACDADGRLQSIGPGEPQKSL